MGYQVVVLGAGRQGMACAYDLLQQDEVARVILADASETTLHQTTARLKSLLPTIVNKLGMQQVNVEDVTTLMEFLKPHDVLISAVPYFYNLALTDIAIASRTHMVDMGGNTDVVFEQHKRHEQARQAGITILPDAGLAPGLGNILAADGIGQMDAVDSVQIRVGGLPQEPVPPLNYQLFFSVHGLINEYIGQAVVLRHGKRVVLDTLTELETLPFAYQDRALEAFVTLGGLSTLPWTYEGKIQTMDYKTIRYAGHCSQIQALAQLGLFDEEPVSVNGQAVVPREVTAHLIEQHLNFRNNHDVVLVRIRVSGHMAGQPLEITYDITDHYDETTGFTAMMRTTAYPVSILAEFLGNQTIHTPGVFSLETIVPTQRFIKAFKERHIPLEIKKQQGIPALSDT